MSTVGDIALRFALEEIRDGASEIGGNNQGPFCEKYLNAAHPGQLTHRGEPWCAAFWSWCWLQAAQESGRSLPVAYSRSCGVLFDRFTELGLLGQRGVDPATVQPGDAVFWDHDDDGRPNHVNMVYAIHDRVLFTIGGNEGPQDSGAPVQIKKRGRLADLHQVLGIGLMSRAGTAS